MNQKQRGSGAEELDTTTVEPVELGAGAYKTTGDHDRVENQGGAKRARNQDRARKLKQSGGEGGAGKHHGWWSQ